VCCCEAVQKIPSQRVDPALLQLVLLAAALMTLLNVARSGRYAKRVKTDSRRGLRRVVHAAVARS
jgi:hypothetical protein